jgi:hypothetical protein
MKESMRYSTDFLHESCLDPETFCAAEQAAQGILLSNSLKAFDPTDVSTRMHGGI